jgi:hypothetical protein
MSNDDPVTPLGRPGHDTNRAGYARQESAPARVALPAHQLLVLDPLRLGRLRALLLVQIRLVLLRSAPLCYLSGCRELNEASNLNVHSPIRARGCRISRNAFAQFLVICSNPRPGDRLVLQLKEGPPRPDGHPVFPRRHRGEGKRAFPGAPRATAFRSGEAPRIVVAIGVDQPAIGIELDLPHALSIQHERVHPLACIRGPHLRREVMILLGAVRVGKP